jgi:Ni,Fe-hydrogenase III large subunit
VRVILLELERLYNHITDIGALCNDVGFGVLNAHAQRIREQLLRINATVTGHRLLRGSIRPGTATVDAMPDAEQLRAIAADIAEIVSIALDHTVVHDRFAGTAVLTNQQATDLGTLGYVARASGLDTDARRDQPWLRPGPAFAVCTEKAGDVLARFTVRAREIQIATDLIAELLDNPVQHEPTADDVTASGTGVGIIEGWRGTITHRIELRPDGTLGRVKVVDPSFFNWPALPLALTDTIVPDFPLTNKSFNLSYAGNDL